MTQQLCEHCNWQAGFGHSASCPTNLADKSQRICDFNSQDELALKEYIKTGDTLIGLVLEIIRDNPAMLLSPICRKQIIEAAERFQRRHNRIVINLAVDNPGKTSLRIIENAT